MDIVNHDADTRLGLHTPDTSRGEQTGANGYSACDFFEHIHLSRVTGRTYYQLQHTPNQTDPINKLHRAHHTAIFRLRTHHAPLNAHLHRIKKEHPAKCVYCPDSDETVEHFLFHCPLYDNIRTRLLPAQPNIHNTLYEPTTQLQRTTTYNISAMNRRDTIVLSEVWGTKKSKRVKV